MPFQLLQGLFFAGLIVVYTTFESLKLSVYNYNRSRFFILIVYLQIYLNESAERNIEYNQVNVTKLIFNPLANPTQTRSAPLPLPTTISLPNPETNLELCFFCMFLRLYNMKEPFRPRSTYGVIYNVADLSLNTIRNSRTK